MPKEGSLKSLLKRAENREKKYDWLKAVALYEQGLGMVGKDDFSKKGEIQEKIGYCFHRAAFQAEAQEEFRKRMDSSVKAYEEGAEFFERSVDSKDARAHSRHCKATASYSKFWIAKATSEKKALLDECRKLEKEALKVYEETGDKVGYVKTCNELLACLYDRSGLARHFQEAKNFVEEAMEYCKKSIEALSEIRDECELARANYMLAISLWNTPGIYESVEKQKEIVQKSMTYAQKALDISEKTGDSYIIGMSSWLIGWIINELKGDFESSLRYVEKGLESSRKAKDNLMIARAYDLLAYIGFWKMDVEEDPDKRRKGYNEAIRYAEYALNCHQWFSYPNLGMVYLSHLESYWALAFFKTNLEEKRVLLEKAVEVGRTHLEKAKRSGSLSATGFVLHSLSKALYSLSTMETKISEKRKLLNEASMYREENISINERGSPFDYWNRGVGHNYLALIEAELAKIKTNNQERIDLVRKAIMDMEDCLKFCQKHARARPLTRLFSSIGYYLDWFGDVLNQLYLLTGEKRHLERAIGVHEDAIQALEEADLHSRVAETCWKMAKLHDQLGKHSKAAGNFESASEKYRLAAEKIPQLKAFYSDYAVYVRAWSEIERAKHHHAEKQYGLAQEHYEKAASLHMSTERWKYLNSNYLALARVEEAEDLSRKEQAEEARELFQKAANLFAEAKESIKVTLEKIEARDEKEMATELAKASGVREEYSLGRIALEEAKILDRQGDHTESSRKYGFAAKNFQKAIDSMEHESDRQELRPIVDLCKAWQKMTQAEAEASPDLYLEASQLFEEVKKHSLDQKAKTLALGHSCFCKALEAGTRFEATRDMTSYSVAKKYMEASEGYYLKAGFKSASEYAKATCMVFDAYVYVHKAETETNPVKKAQYYQMAEKLLQTSAGSYMKAKHPEKSEEVQRLLEGIKEKKELAVSLTEVLHAPTATSTTVSFSTPTPTQEQAVGLERFQHADIQASLIFRVKEAKVGDDIEFRIEMVNAGKTPALLVKVDETAPEGFKLKEVPEIYAIEDSFINLKGKRLNPLKTEDVEVVVTPQSKGTFVMKPRILYLDETGKYKSHEPEPVTLTVKELGISGWIKGER